MCVRVCVRVRVRVCVCALRLESLTQCGNTAVIRSKACEGSGEPLSGTLHYFLAVNITAFSRAPRTHERGDVIHRCLGGLRQ